MEPETSNFFGNELDKAKLEIVSYWKDKHEKTRKALEIAVDALNRIDKQLMTGIEMTCQARNALEQITALEQKEQ